MAVEVKMPQLSDTMNSGKILAWRVKEGQKVSRGDILAEVETDKANLEIECFQEGTLLQIVANEGVDAPVGSVIALIGNAGESVQGRTSGKGGSNGQGAQAPAKESQPAAKGGETGSKKNQPQPAQDDSKVVSIHGGTHESAIPSPSPQPAGAKVADSGNGVRQRSTAVSGDSLSGQSDESERRIKASPLARKLATQHGLDLAAVRGSGPEGRIIRQDIERAVEQSSSDSERFSQPQQQTSGAGETHAPSAIASYQRSTSAGEDIPQSSAGAPAAAGAEPQRGAAPIPAAAAQGTVTPLNKMRATIARRMEESIRSTPHFYMTTAVDMRQAVRFREAIKEDAKLKGVTLNHLVVKAAAYALEREPRVNCSYRDGALYDPGQINIGIITALDDGLIIPVVREANTLPLAALAFEVRAAIDRARAGRPSAADLSGGTFSISNMGMYDVENFTAIINPGQGGIIAVSSVQDAAIVEQGLIVPGKQMKVTLSVDHRIIDGVIAARFLQHFRRALEIPALLGVS